MLRWSMFLILAIGCIAWMQGNAQQVVFRKGYVVYPQGDTVVGYVGLKNWYDCTKKVWFSKDAWGRKNILLTVANCKAFGVPGQERFVRGVLNEDNHCTADVEDLPCYYEIGNPRLMTVFFRAVSEGVHYILYEYRDGVTERYAIGTRQPTGRIKLTNLNGPVPYIDRITGDVYYEYPHRFQLLWLQDSNDYQLNKDIRKSSYGRESLMTVIDDMNKQPAEYRYQPENHSRSNNFASVGVTKLTFVVQGLFPPSPGGEKFKVNTTPLVKLGRDFNNAWKLPFLTLRTSIMMWSANYTGYVASNPAQVNYSLRQFTVEPSVGLLYAFLKRSSVELYAGLDGGLNIPISSHDDLIEGGGSSKVVTANYTGLRSYYWSSNVMLGAFLGHRKWEVAGFYQLTQCFAWNDGYAFNPRMWGLTVGYHFTQK